MGRMYTVVIDQVAVSAAQDLVALKTSANVPIILHEVRLSQKTDVGNAAEQQLVVKIIRGTTTLGSGGTVPTPAPTGSGNTASVTTAHINDTTPASAGTAVKLFIDDFNDRIGFLYVPTPETRFDCPVGTILQINLPNAPANSITVSGTVTFEEIGV